VTAHPANGLDLGRDGRPTRPLHVLDLTVADGWSDEEIRATAETVLSSAALTIGVAREEPGPRLTPLIEAATLTVAVPGACPRATTVAVDDPDAALARLRAAVDATPQAAIALGQLLRQTVALPTAGALAAEAAVYSMLLSGAEFRRWLAGTTRPLLPGDPDERLVDIVRSGDAIEVVLNRPERRNALSFAMREQLYEALELPSIDTTIHHVRIRGSGPTFCSGGDLAEFGAAHDLVAAYLVRLDRAPWRLVDQLRDRIAVHVHGAAVGAGAEIAAFAGQVTATADATFRLPELAMGLVPGAGGTVSIPRRVGRWRAAWLMLTGVALPAQQALEWGLVDTIHEAP